MPETAIGEYFNSLPHVNLFKLSLLV